MAIQHDLVFTQHVSQTDLPYVLFPLSEYGFAKLSIPAHIEIGPQAPRTAGWTDPNVFGTIFSYMTEKVPTTGLCSKVPFSQSKSFHGESLLHSLASELTLLRTHDFEHESSFRTWLDDTGNVLVFCSKLLKV